jgi:hypothetical protein
MEEKSAKILSVSLSTWRADSGVNTQTDLFKYWERDRVAQIYTKSNLPDTPVCDRFFQISENAVIRSVYTRKPVGRQVHNGAEADEQSRKAIEAEKDLYIKAHKKKSWLMTIAREIVWATGKWKTNALDQFIREFDPDVYFIPIYPVVYMGKLQLYILKKHPRPYVCYLADDNYSYKACGQNVFAYIHRFFLRKVVAKLAVNCNEMFTITQTEAVETDEQFGTHSVVMTKGIDYSKLVFREKDISEPISMVYTGKLVIGRASSLAAISKALAEINKDRLRMTLDIYSHDVVDDKTMKLFNSNGCSYKGGVPKESVAPIQEAADIVVFVESLEKKYRYAARLSFSTKLTDYFMSGKCIFAIGDKSIAPIEYLKNNDAAVIASDYSEITDQLRKLTENHEMISIYARKAFECGKRNHDVTQVRKVFISTFTKAADSRGKFEP